MHPPFFHVDHKIGHDPHFIGHQPKPKRRTRPEALTIAPARFAPVPFAPVEPAPVVLLPPDDKVVLMPHIHVVTAPQSTLRDLLGRLLIRIGQRLILAKRAPL